MHPPPEVNTWKLGNWFVLGVATRVPPPPGNFTHALSASVRHSARTPTPTAPYPWEACVWHQAQTPDRTQNPSNHHAMAGLCSALSSNSTVPAAATADTAAAHWHCSVCCGDFFWGTMPAFPRAVIVVALACEEKTSGKRLVLGQEQRRAVIVAALACEKNIGRV